MIDTETLIGDQSFLLQKIKPENESLNLIQLAAMTIEFYQKLNLIRLNFEGPDYFGVWGNFSDLQILLIKMADVLNLLQAKDSHERIWIGQNFFEKENLKLMDSSNNDAERISVIVTDLGNLIQSYKDSASDTSQEESFFNEVPFRNILVELENMHWIFTMFSKY